jgi:RimJ/RimL family protein N-acetyltransferase
VNFGFKRADKQPVGGRPEEGRVVAVGAVTRVREMTREDVDRWLEWPRHSDPLWVAYNPPILSRRQRDLYFEQHRCARASRQYSVDTADGEFVGRISIRDIDWRLGAAVLGISFNPGRLNQGLGSDALASFLHFYFNELQMRSMFLDVAAFNHRARRVYEKNGFRAYGDRLGEPQPDHAGVFVWPEAALLRPYFRREGSLVRPIMVDMVLRREEWMARQSSRPGAVATLAF